jgi:hypothetical protein
VIARTMLLEMRRGAGFTLLVGLAGLGSLMTVMAAVSADRELPWSTSGPGIVAWLNTTGLLLGPLAAAVGAWVGGRERRLGVEEVLAAVSRSRWQRDLTGFATLSVTVTGGLLLVGAAVTATVRPAISYSGGRWPLSALLVALGCVTCLALGFSIGRLMPHRWTAPVVTIVVYLLSGIPTYLDGGVAHLSPVSNLPAGDGQRVRFTIAALAAVWLIGLTTAVLLAGIGRRRAWALLPAALAVLAAVPLVSLPVRWNGNSYTATWTERDPHAMSRVCSLDSTVCLNAVHASLLPAVTELVRPILAELPAGTVAAERGLEHPAERPAVNPGELPIPFLEGRTALFTTDLRERDSLRADIVGGLLRVWCPGDSASVAQAYGIATALLPGGEQRDETATGSITARLREDPVARRAWLAAYLDAGRTCEPAAFDELVGR